MENRCVQILLCGDVMTGRGIDQCLEHPSDPVLFEPFVKNAKIYVDLAQKKNGHVRRKINASYLWGDAPKTIKERSPDVFLANLETAITTSPIPYPDKSIHYRMHPGNIGILKELGITCCSIANNHSLDWGREGFEETLKALKSAGIRVVGGGETITAAEKPAGFQINPEIRVLIFAVGATDSGIPLDWKATDHQSGLFMIDAFNQIEAERVSNLILKQKQKEDIAILSIHWGGNWGYPIPRVHEDFAHFLIDQGCVDLIHGHSSHHRNRHEVYRNKLILYGCGDFMTDYEGISGYESYHPSSSLLYFATYDMQSHELVKLEIVHFELKRFQLVKCASKVIINKFEHSIGKIRNK
jgi:poly-gamma-glutamate synthesis protein (capsule biosynthesis protein)